MNVARWSFAGVGLIFLLGSTGCGMVKGHVDCDQVAQQQRSGTSDIDIAQQSGFSVGDVQACSQTGSSGGRETANNYQDAPRLPYIPTIGSGVIH
jgi:hypothetical protein